MAKRRINQLFDLEALAQERAKLKSDNFKFLDDLQAKLEGMADIKVSIGNASNFKELNAAQLQYNAYIKQTESLVKQLADTEAKIVVLRQRESQQLTENKLKIQQLNKEQRDRIKLQDAEKGSIAELSLKYDKAYRIYKQLNEAQREAPRGQAIQKYLSDTSTKLKELEGNVGQFQRNVGNYSGAFKNFANTLQGLQGPTKLLGELFGIGGEQLDQFRIFVEHSLQALSSFFKAKEAKVGSEVKDAAATAASTAAMQAQATTTAAATGTTETFTVVTAESAVALEAEAVAAGAASKATGLFMNILKFSGIALVVTAFAALVYQLYQVSKSFSAVSESQRIMGELNREAVKGYGDQVAKIEILKTKLNDLTISQTDRVKYAKQYNEVADEGNKIDVTQINNLTEVNGKIEKQISLLKQRAFAKAAENIISQKAEELFKAQLKLGEVQSRFPGINDQSRKNLIDQAGRELEQVAKNRNEKLRLTSEEALNFASLPDDLLNKAIANNTAKLGVFYDERVKVKLRFIANEVRLIDEAQKGDRAGTNGLLIKIAKDDVKTAEQELNKYLKILGGFIDTRSFMTDGNNTPAKPQEIKDNTAQVILKEQFEQKKILLQQSVDADRKVFEDETQIYSDRLDALKTFTAGQINLINLQKDFEIAAEKLRLVEVIAGLEKMKKEKGANIKAINEQEEKEKKASNEIITTAILKANAGIIKAGEDFSKDLKILKNNRQKLREEEKQDIIDFNEWEQKQYDATLARYKKGLEERKAADQKAADWKKRQQDETREYAFKTAEETMNTVLFFITKSIDNETAALNTRKRLLDEETARRINQINMLGLTDVERVKRIAEVEKQAMFQTEEFEKRKRKLAVERAKFEKLANIASIISNTAAAIMKILKDVPYPFNVVLAVATGALGALQLARAVAAPIPQYRSGTSSAKKGLALVSEEGPELMERNGQMYLTPKGPTLMEMAGGEQITPAHLTRDILNSTVMHRPKFNSSDYGMSKGQAEIFIEEIKSLKSEIRDLKAVTERTKIAIYNHPSIESDPYYINNVKR